MLIVGSPTATRYAVDRNCPTDTGAVWKDMVDALWNAALEHGIDPVVMVAQSAHETGWGRYAGSVPATFFNTAGLKVRDPKFLGSTKLATDPMTGLSATDLKDTTLAHAQFASWQTGARAHAQHLLAYTGDFLLLPGEELLAPRRVWLEKYKTSPITTVEELSTRWAPSSDYGERVAAVARRLIGTLA